MQFMHNAKVKFFRSLNSILGKVGTSSPISVSINLVTAYCNPVLLYGLESIRLSKANSSSISYPFNSVFMKLFSTFDKSVVTLCQFYCGQIPLSYLVDLRMLKFCDKLSSLDSNSANILCNLFGKLEQIETANTYGIDVSDLMYSYEYKIRQTFVEFASSLI